MRPLKLTMSAFGPYERETVIDFTALGDCSFFLIHGATGAGKTTILDAICYAFYGDASVAGRTGSMLRSQQAGPEQETFVEFIFTIGEKTYRLRRNPDYLRKSKRQTKNGNGLTAETAGAELWRIDGEPVCLVTGPVKVTAKMTELLGFASEQFRQVVLLPQGEFRRLLMADSMERQSIMEVLFRTEFYRKIEDSLKARAQKINTSYQELQKEQDFLLRDTEAANVDEFRTRLAARREQLAASQRMTREQQKNRETAQQAERQGRETASRFAALDAAQQQLAGDESKLAVVAAFRQQLERAQQAAGLADVEAQAQQALHEAAEKETAVGQQELRSQQLQQKLAVARKHAEEMRAREPERQGLQQELQRLTEYGQQSAAIGEARQRLAAAEAEAGRLQQVRQAAEEKRQQLQEGLAALQQQEKQQTQVAAGRAALALQLEGLEHRQQLLLEFEQSRQAEQQAVAGQTAAEKAAEKADAVYEEQRREVERLQHLFAEGQAALLAKELPAGSPCPVCGSCEHPHLAVSTELIPDEAEIRRAQRELQNRDRLRQTAAKGLQTAQAAGAAASSRRAERQQALGENIPAAADLQAELQAAQAALQAACTAEQEQQRLAAAISQQERGLTQQGEASEAAAAAQVKAAQESAQAAGILQEKLRSLPEEYQAPEALAQARATIQQQFTALTAEQQAAEDAFHALETAAAAQTAALTAAKTAAAAGRRQEQRLTEAFAERRVQAGFATLEEYRQALTGKFATAEGRSAVAQRIRSFEDAHTAAQAAWKKASEDTRSLVRPQLEQLTAALAAAEKAVNESYAAEKKLEAEINRQGQQLQRLEALLTKSAGLEKEYRTVGRLAAVASGENAYRTSFQRYVLRSLLSDVVEAANSRLRLMSRGQYELRQTLEVRDQRKKAGLDLVIFDAYTGYERQMATLSGGESFLASLSLALGLADVVQSYAGGIRLDTIFIDEGFGTLDAETLDMAIKALLELQKGGRLVGIISHVEELKERIDARLEITKHREGGSQARFILG